MRQTILGSVVLLASLHFIAPVHASYLYQLTDAAGVEQSNFVIDGINQTVDVNVWLKQVDTDTLTWEGLALAGVKITYSSPGIAEVVSLTDITRNPAFDDPGAFLTDAGTGYSTLNVGVSDPFSPVYPDSATPNSIWLGTFKFTGLGLGSVQITALDDADVDNTVTGQNTLLDPDVGSVQATISTIPEPSGLVLLSGLALIVGPYLRRRRVA